jgi:hypothetical protein
VDVLVTEASPDHPVTQEIAAVGVSIVEAKPA